MDDILSRIWRIFKKSSLADQSVCIILDYAAEKDGK
jgi:hypothetical protein